MRLLLINPNTSAAITDLVAAEARKIIKPDVELSAVTGRFGGRYVASRAAYAIAGYATLEAYAETGQDADAVLLACFGDPGLLALREIARQPVIGMAEASCLTAAAFGGRFAIVTGGDRWGPMLREFVAMIGLTDRLAVVQTVAPSGADIARDPQSAMDLLVAACQSSITDHGASRIILGGAGLAGLAARIADRVDVPLIDSLIASVQMAEQAGREHHGKRYAAASTAVETVGLTAKLAALLRGSA